MALNIRKVTAQRAENNQNYKKDNFYIISIEIVFFTHPDTYVPASLSILQTLALFKLYILLLVSEKENVLLISS